MPDRPFTAAWPRPIDPGPGDLAMVTAASILRRTLSVPPRRPGTATLGAVVDGQNFALRRRSAGPVLSPGFFVDGHRNDDQRSLRPSVARRCRRPRPDPAAVIDHDDLLVDPGAVGRTHTCPPDRGLRTSTGRGRRHDRRVGGTSRTSPTRPYTAHPARCNQDPFLGQHLNRHRQVTAIDPALTSTGRLPGTLLDGSRNDRTGARFVSSAPMGFLTFTTPATPPWRQGPTGSLTPTPSCRRNNAVSRPVRHRHMLDIDIFSLFRSAHRWFPHPSSKDPGPAPAITDGCNQSRDAITRRTSTTPTSHGTAHLHRPPRRRRSRLAGVPA